MKIGVIVRTIGQLVLLVCVAAPASARQSAPPSPQALRVAQIAGQLVTFQWAAPPSGQAPDHYVIEGGFSPGTVWATASIDGSATTATFTLANGTYFVRLRAVKAGLQSAVSNEVQAVVGGFGRPSTPADVSAVTLGTSVTLTWRTPDDGPGIEAIVLEVTGAVQGSFVVPSTAPVTFSGVPHGTYTVTLRARNAVGVSDPSSPVTFSVLGTPAPGIQVVQGPTQDVNAPRMPVRYEDMTAPRLVAFAARERLDLVVQGSGSEFERILRLKDWVAAQWESGNPDPYPPWDAMTILDWIRGGLTGGFCAQYSQVFVQALAAFGIPARYVEVGHEENPYNHYPTEVWSNTFNKWVLMDVSYNHHFERRGVPQSALEVHEAYVRGDAADLVLVRGAVTKGHPDPLELPHRTTELYYYLRYHLKANHVSAPAEDPFNRYGDMLEWHDGWTVPWEVSTAPSQFPHEQLTRESLSDREAAEWRPNQVWITPRQTGSSEVTLDLAHSVLQFSHLLYRIIDDAGVAGPWRSHASPQLIWKISGRDRRLEVRGVNVRGAQGPITAVAIVSP